MFKEFVIVSSSSVTSSKVRVSPGEGYNGIRITRLWGTTEASSVEYGSRVQMILADARDDMAAKKYGITQITFDATVTDGTTQLIKNEVFRETDIRVDTLEFYLIVMAPYSEPKEYRLNMEFEGVTFSETERAVIATV